MVVREVISQLSPKLPAGYDEYIEGFELTNVATGEQASALSLTKPGIILIKDVFVYCAGMQINGYFKIARGTTGSNVDLCGNIYWNAATFISFDHLVASNLGVVFKIDHAAGSNQTVYVVVKYYYET